MGRELERIWGVKWVEDINKIIETRGLDAHREVVRKMREEQERREKDWDGEQKCYTCQHEDVFGLDDPCSVCDGVDKWESQGIEGAYEGLFDVLMEAYKQASEGKGKERHGNDLPFEEQPMQTMSQLLGSNKGCLFQAMKKIQESTRMEKDAAVRELLGAIVYLAGAVIYLEGEGGRNECL